MIKYFVVLSLFDGIGVARSVIDKIKPKGYKVIYYACEIDERGMKIAKANYPDIIHLGDVRDLHRDMIPYHINLIIGGSPCQDLSLAGNKGGLGTDMLSHYLKLKKEEYEFKGQSYLFWEYIRILKEFNPDYFLLENVTKIGTWKNVISNALGVLPIKINSALVSAQNRDRFYWTNIPNVGIPEDRGILFSNLVPGATGYGVRGKWIEKLGKCDGVYKSARKDGKANCVLTKSTGTQQYQLSDGSIHKMTVDLAERLQTLPKGYTKVMGISEAAKYHAIGNSFTAEVIKHIFRHIPELK